MEKFLDILDSYEQDRVKKKERDVVGQRRFLSREMKVVQERLKFKQKQEESFAKLNRPALKKVGKPNMFRSNPPQIKKKEEVVLQNDEQAELKKYF